MPSTRRRTTIIIIIRLIPSRVESSFGHILTYLTHPMMRCQNLPLAPKKPIKWRAHTSTSFLSLLVISFPWIIDLTSIFCKVRAFQGRWPKACGSRHALDGGSDCGYKHEWVASCGRGRSRAGHSVCLSSVNFIIPHGGASSTKHGLRLLLLLLLQKIW